MVLPFFFKKDVLTDASFSSENCYSWIEYTNCSMNYFKLIEPLVITSDDSSCNKEVLRKNCDLCRGFITEDWENHYAKICVRIEGMSFLTFFQVVVAETYYIVHQWCEIPPSMVWVSHRGKTNRRRWE